MTHDTTLENIDRDSLRERIETGADFVLVDALSPMSFAASHLPGAINLTPGWVDDGAEGLQDWKDAGLPLRARASRGDGDAR